jgi:hypothetical protein
MNTVPSISCPHCGGTVPGCQLCAALAAPAVQAAPTRQDLILTIHELRVQTAALYHALSRIDVKAEAGLCQYTHVGARTFLKDIRAIVTEAKECDLML